MALVDGWEALVDEWGALVDGWVELVDGWVALVDGWGALVKGGVLLVECWALVEDQVLLVDGWVPDAAIPDKTSATLAKFLNKTQVSKHPPPLPPPYNVVHVPETTIDKSTNTQH